MHNTFQILITTSLICLGVFQTVQAQASTEYYRHLVFRESPISDHRGIYPITEAEINEVAHYRFDYDEDGRVIEISYRIGDQLIRENGNWDTFTWWSSKITYEYSNQQIIVRFFDHFDEPIEALGGAAKAVFEIDSDGYKTALSFYNLNDEPTENHWNVHRYAWTYPEKGTVIEQRFNLADEEAFLRPNLTFKTVKLVYGDDDLLDFMYNIDDDGKLVNNTMGAAIDRIVYDRNHNFIRWMVFDADTNLVEGNAPQFALGEHLYDEFGNKTGMRGYDIHMKRKAFPSGTIEVYREYDNYGNMVSEKFEGIAQEEVVQQVKRYSDDGVQLLTLTFFDDQGKLKNHPSVGWAELKLSYDSTGRVANREFFTQDGTLIES